MDWSVSVDGKMTDALLTDATVIESYTKYDGSKDQKMDYTWNAAAGCTYGDTAGIDASAWGALSGTEQAKYEVIDGTYYKTELFDTSVLYDYGTGKYLLKSQTVEGIAVSLVSSDLIESQTIYDGSKVQRMVYTWNYKSGTAVSSRDTASTVDTSTIYDYTAGNTKYMDAKLYINRRPHSTCDRSSSRELHRIQRHKRPEDAIHLELRRREQTISVRRVTGGYEDNRFDSIRLRRQVHDWSVSVDGKMTDALLTDATVIESYTKYDGSKDQKMDYTWNAAAGCTYGDTAGIDASAWGALSGTEQAKYEVIDGTYYKTELFDTSVLYDYGTGKYLLKSQTVEGIAVSLVSSDLIESQTIYDGSKVQRMVYTWNYKSGTAVSSRDTASTVDTSTIYDYTAGNTKYMDASHTLTGGHTALAIDLVVESYTEYNDTKDQKMLYTWNYEGGSKLLALGALPADTKITDSTVYGYVGRYMDWSVSVDGKMTDALLTDATVIESYTKYDGSKDQKMDYTWNAAAGCTYGDTAGIDAAAWGRVNRNGTGKI